MMDVDDLKLITTSSGTKSAMFACARSGGCEPEGGRAQHHGRASERRFA